MIRQACDHCSRRFKIPAKYLGKRIQCPVCGEPILIAAATPTKSRPIQVAASSELVVPELQSAGAQAKPASSSPANQMEVRYHFPWFDPFVAVGMLGLAAGYAGLILAILAGVAYHALYNYTSIIALGDEASFLVFVIYIGIIVIGLGVAFFLLKPLLSKRRKSLARRVTRSSEPALFMMLNDISAYFSISSVTVCELENHFDIEARYIRSGEQKVDSIILGIGFPMFVNLSQQQAASLIAQEMIEKTIEFQSPIARLIRWVHSWFFNAAQIRDSWDQTLSRIRFRRGIISTPLVMLVQFCVFVNRRVLWGFFLLSQLISNISFRNYYAQAASLALNYTGEDAFLDCIKELPVTRSAFRQSLKQFVQSYHTTQAVDDLAGLTEAERKRMDKASVLAMQMNLERSWTKPWESRPNLRRAEKITRRFSSKKSRSLFGSAKQLFTNFKSLSRQITQDIHEFLMMGDFVQLKDFDRRMLNIGFTRLPTGMNSLND